MATTNRDLNELTPQFKKKVELFLKEVGNEIFITEGYRSQERQNELYAQGRTKPGNIVTWTLNSNHTDRTAIDIAFKGNELYPSDIKSWERIAEIAKKYGIKWMYPEWKIDKPHFVDDGFPYKEKQTETTYKDYKGMEVVFSDTMCGKDANACTFKGFNKIFITSKFLKEKDEDIKESYLEHEYAHQVYWKATKTYQELWEKVSSGDEITLNTINIALGKDYENKYVTSYAEKGGVIEDFAENIRVILLRGRKKVTTKYNNFIDVKMSIAQFIYNKFK